MFTKKESSEDPHSSSSMLDNFRSIQIQPNFLGCRYILNSVLGFRTTSAAATEGEREQNSSSNDYQTCTSQKQATQHQV